MSRYFLGVDVGATKTRALVADESGLVLGSAQGGPGNHEVVGYDGLSQALRAAVEPALAKAGITTGDVAGAGFGVAGYDWPSEREPTLEAIRLLGLGGRLEVVNDALIGLLAGADEGWGVAVVAGTGCNGWGWDRQRRVGRMTGLGTWMGEGAGASELMGRALGAVSRAWSRRGPATRLTRVLIDYCGARDASDLLEGLGLGRYELDGAAAPLVFQAAADGDKVAGQVVRWAGRELGSLAVGVIRQLGLEGEAFEVVLVGSLFDAGTALIEPMARAVARVAPRAGLARLTAPPAVGGVLLGMEVAGASVAGLRQRLTETCL